jgi:hypothetical protein
VTCADLAASNTFTANPQAVGTAFSSGQTLIYNGQITLGDTPDGSHVPSVKLYGYCGGATGNNGWDLGIDTANHGGGQDFYLGKVTNGATNDIFFINYTSGAMGIGAATPPTDDQWLQIISSASDTKGCLALQTGSGATGKPFTIAESSGTVRFGLDSDFNILQKAGTDYGLVFLADATDFQVMAFTNPAKAVYYQYIMSDNTSSATIKFRNGNGTGDAWSADNTGLVTFPNGITVSDAKNIAVGSTTGTKIGTATTQKLGFFNAAPVAQQATTGTTAGFTAGSGTAMNSASTSTGNNGSTAYTFGDVVHALKSLGLMAA